MTACLYYRRRKDYENEWRWQQVFKGQCLGSGCWPSSVAPAGTPLRRESKLSAASKQQAPWYMWYGDSGLSARPCHLKEHPHKAAVHPEGLSPGSSERTHCRHASCCPFLQPVRLSAQRNISVSCQRCSPTAFAGRRLLPDLGQPSLYLCYLQVTSTVPAEAHLPLPLLAPPLSEANYLHLPLQCWDASRSVVANAAQGSSEGYFITYSFLDIATFFQFEFAVLEDGSLGHLMRNITVSKTLPSRHCSPFPPSHASRPCERKQGCSRTRSAESSMDCPHACCPPSITHPPGTILLREEAFAPTERRGRPSTSL